MITLRKTKDEAKYQKYLKSGKKRDLWQEKPMFVGDGYTIIKNRFPYSRIYKEHLLLLTKKNVMFALKKAYEYAEKNKFRSIILNTKLAQTVPETVHVHIVR